MFLFWIGFAGVIASFAALAYFDNGQSSRQIFHAPDYSQKESVFTARNITAVASATVVDAVAGIFALLSNGLKKVSNRLRS